MRRLAPLLLVLAGCTMTSMPAPETLEVRCVGHWTWAPHVYGQGHPPVGFRELEIVLEPGATGDERRGTVIWDGVAWPMQLEWSEESGSRVRYDAGAPFADPVNPDGIAFSMLRHTSDKPRWDELYVDFRRLGLGEDESVESGWYRFVRDVRR